MTEPRTPRSDDCPHCGKSNWMGRSCPDGCQCSLPWRETQLMARFIGDAVSAHAHGGHGATYAEGLDLEVHATVRRRVDLFHFIRGLEFHLRSAVEEMQRVDTALQDRTCRSCGLVQCACPEQNEPMVTCTECSGCGFRVGYAGPGIPGAVKEVCFSCGGKGWRPRPRG